MNPTADLDVELETLWRGSNLTAAQCLVWLSQKRHADLPAQHIAVLWFIPKAVDAERLEAAFQRVIDGCDALRTVIEDQAGLPQQQVLPEVRVSLETVDLSHTPDSLNAAKAWSVQRAQSVFKLVGSSRVDLQACKLEYSIVSPK